MSMIGHGTTIITNFRDLSNYTSSVKWYAEVIIEYYLFNNTQHHHHHDHSTLFSVVSPFANYLEF